MRFHLNTLFEILIIIALWSIIRCKLWDILTFKMNILQMEFSFMSQHTHTQKVLKHLYIKKTHPLNTPIVVHLIDVSDHFCSQEDDIETLFDHLWHHFCSKVPYFNKISGLMYIAILHTIWHYLLDQVTSNVLLSINSGISNINSIKIIRQCNILEITFIECMRIFVVLEKFGIKKFL